MDMKIDNVKFYEAATEYLTQKALPESNASHDSSYESALPAVNNVVKKVGHDVFFKAFFKGDVQSMNLIKRVITPKM